MAVKVERDPDLAVAEPLARDLRVDAARKQVGGMGMTQVVEANARQTAIAGKEADPLLAEAVRTARASRPPASPRNRRQIAACRAAEAPGPVGPDVNAMVRPRPALGSL